LWAPYFHDYCSSTWARSTLIIFIFRNFKNFPKEKIQDFFWKGNKESDEIFENISFVEMESSKLIN